jgi:O-antigen polymerase
MILSDSVKLFWSKRSFFGKSSLIVVSVLTVLVFGLLFYRTKQASSEGRLLIWKVSTKMIQEHPMGIGIGMFEHDYNLRQGEYFASGESTERERYNSGTVNMAYNDFLEHCVEAGIPGFLFIISFYVYLMFLTYRRKDTELFSYFSAVFLISWLNFIYSSIQPWIVLMTYASIAISQNINMEPKRNGIANKVIALGLLLLCSGLLYRHIPLLYSQFRLKQLQVEAQEDNSFNLSNAESLSAYVGTSEAYYRFLSEQYMWRKMYEKALDSNLSAMHYTSTPELYFFAFKCYDCMGKTEEGIPYIEEVRRMLPQNLTSRLVLLRWYDNEHQYKEAISIAKEINNMHVKINNEQAASIKQYAKEYLNRNQPRKIYKNEFQINR